MRALGFISTFDELASADRRLGRKVANYGMVAALLEHSSAEELHFFLPFAGALKPFEAGYAKWLERPEIKDRVHLWHAAGMASVLERRPFDAFHAGELDRYFPELCHLRNRLTSDPFPVTCTTHTLSYWSSQVRNLYKVLPGPRPYDAVFCTSRAARLHLEQSFAQSSQRLADLGLSQAGFRGGLEIVPLGVDAREFGQVEREPARKELGLDPGAFTLLCLGRLTATDKFDLMPLLGCLALLSRQVELQVILAGAADSGHGRELEDMAKQMGLAERVHVFANFDSALKPKLYGAADVLVSPADNLQETFGLSILEAMAAGLPVVASDFSGYRDLVEHKKTGYLIPTLGPSDYHSLDAVHPLLGERTAALQISQRTAIRIGPLLEALTALAENPERAKEMGRAGRQRVLDRFDWPKVVGLMEQTWRKLGDAARQEPPSGSMESDVLGAGLGPSFGHFVSRSLDGRDVLVPGPLAGQFLAGAWAAEPYADLAGIINPKGLKRLLASVAKSGGGARLANLCDELAAEMPAYHVEHLALYGLKYGVLELK